MSKIFYTLRAANIARTVEWTLGQGLADLTWRATELVGEVWEAYSELKDPGLWERRSLVGAELADVVICIDLTAMDLGLEEIPIMSRGGVTRAGIAPVADNMLHAAASICNPIKKLERERRGWLGSRAEVTEVESWLRVLMGHTGLAASYCKLDLRAEVEAKFNGTSEKVGLETRLVFL